MRCLFNKIEYHKVRILSAKLINTDSNRSILFPCDYHKTWFGNEHILFHVLKTNLLMTMMLE